MTMQPIYAPRPQRRPAYPTCRHCGEALPLHGEDARTLVGLCPDCADLAVWGAPCAYCGEVPSRHRRCEG